MEGKYQNGKLHILGYNIDFNSDNLIQILNTIRRKRKERAKYILKKLEKIGINFPQEEITNIDNAVGDVRKPYIANLLLKYHYVTEFKEAFDKYLDNKDFPIQESSFSLSKEKVIDTIKKADGIPVSAHFKTLNKNEEEMEVFLKELITLGLMGIETGHSCYTKEHYDIAERKAKKYNLLRTGGSNYHGPIAKKHIKLATWYHE